MSRNTGLLCLWGVLKDGQVEVHEAVVQTSENGRHHYSTNSEAGPKVSHNLRRGKLFKNTFVNNKFSE